MCPRSCWSTVPSLTKALCESKICVFLGLVAGLRRCYRSVDTRFLFPGYDEFWWLALFTVTDVSTEVIMNSVCGTS